MFSAFDPSKWISGQPTGAPGEQLGVLCLAQRSLPAKAGIRTHNLGLPRVSSPTLYPLGHDCTPTSAVHK